MTEKAGGETVKGTPEYLKGRLTELEEKYGVPTARFVDAFRDETGKLHETDDFLAWAMYEAAYRLATHPPTTTGERVGG